LPPSVPAALAAWYCSLQTFWVDWPEDLASSFDVDFSFFAVFLLEDSDLLSFFDFAVVSSAEESSPFSLAAQSE
jgi:hypothetical protein